MPAQKYKKVAPEGGWGYVVAFSVFLALSIQMGPKGSFGVLYVDFLKSVDASTTSVTVTYSLYQFFYSLTALFANILLRNFSCRQVAFTGALIFVTSHLANIFVTSVVYLFITFGILPGIGNGLVIPAMLTCFNGYFSKSRRSVLFASSCIIGLSFIYYPVLIYYFLETYGFRGALALLGGMNLHMIFVALSLQPHEKHQILEEIPDTNEAVESLQPVKGSVPLNDTKTVEEVHLLDVNKSDFSEKKVGIVKIIDWFDLTLLKDLTYVNLIIGITLTEYSLKTFLILQPLYLLSIGWTKEEASICGTVIGISDVLSRVFMAILSYHYKIKSRYIFLAGVILTIIGRIIFSFTTNHVPVIIVTSFIGLLKSWIFVSATLIFQETYSLKRYPAAIGLFTFIQGMAYMIVGPLVGYVRDATGNYSASFHLLNAFLIICCVSWLTEIFWLQMKEKKSIRTNHQT